jgi:hypothetical protein
MVADTYALAIGRVVLDLYSLERALRSYLERIDTSISEAEEGPSVMVGEMLSSSVATNHDALGMLIEKFNRAADASGHGDLMVDTSVADIGAALTTGRIWGRDSQPPLRIVQFSVPTHGLVRCTSTELVDQEWLASQGRRLESALANVEEAERTAQPKEWAPDSQQNHSMTAA